MAKQMKAYEDLLYERWRQQVEVTLPVLLKKNLLTKQETEHDEPTGEVDHVDRSVNLFTVILALLLRRHVHELYKLLNVLQFLAHPVCII